MINKINKAHYTYSAMCLSTFVFCFFVKYGTIFIRGKKLLTLKINVLLIYLSTFLIFSSRANKVSKVLQTSI